MIGRRAILSATALALSAVARAQDAPRLARVGHLTGGTLASRTDYTAAFRQGMRDLGYVEGTNLTLDERGADGRFDRLPMLAQELIALKPSVLFVTTTPANLAAKAATSTIPIVFVGVADPIGVGLVDTLSRPGANLTGITNMVVELTGKRLELLKETVPRASRVAVLVNPDDANALLQLRNAEAAARALHMVLDPILHIRAVADLERVIAAAASADAALRMVDPTIGELRRPTAELAIRHRLPVMHSFREDVEAGGLIAYGADLAGQHRQAATLVHKILRGARPADLPVEQATTLRLVINLKTARAIGITIPSGILARADEVIE